MFFFFILVLSHLFLLGLRRVEGREGRGSRLQSLNFRVLMLDDKRRRETRPHNLNNCIHFLFLDKYSHTHTSIYETNGAVLGLKTIKTRAR